MVGNWVLSYLQEIKNLEAYDVTLRFYKGQYFIFDTGMI